MMRMSSAAIGLNVWRTALVVLIALGANGCMVRHDISYGMHDVPMLAGGSLAHGTVVVETFEDMRDGSVRARQGSFSNAAVVMRDGDDWYCNGDERWKTPIAQGITRAAADHLRATKLFGAVTTREDGAPPAQYALSAKIVRFEACRQREAVKEAFVSQMGLVGLVIQATQKVDYDAVVTLDPVRLIDTATNTTVWEGRAEGTIKGVEPIDAYGWTVYPHATAALKAAVDELVRELAAASTAPSS